LATGIPARLSPGEGRKFAFTLAAAFFVVTAVVWWRGHPTLMRVFAGLGGTFLVLGVVIPGRLGPVYRAWMGLARAISKVTTPIFLGVVYFLVVTPIAPLMKAIGKAPLRVDRNAATYWVTRAPESRRSDLTRQF